MSENKWANGMEPWKTQVPYAPKAAKPGSEPAGKASEHELLRWDFGRFEPKRIDQGKKA